MGWQLAILASHAIPVAARLKMPRTYCAVGLIDQNTVWANGLIAVVFNNRRFTRQKAKDERSQRWSSNMEQMAAPH